jgi:hypothetical protein
MAEAAVEPHPVPEPPKPNVWYEVHALYGGMACATKEDQALEDFFHTEDGEYSAYGYLDEDGARQALEDYREDIEGAAGRVLASIVRVTELREVVAQL